jgi:hypothetical protein
MNVNAVLHDVKETDKSLKAIAAEHGLKSGLHVTSLCLEYGISKEYLQARRGRVNRIIAANAAAERKAPSLIDHDKRHAIQSWVSESMTGDGFSLYWLGRKWV